MGRRDRSSWMLALALFGALAGLAGGWRAPGVIGAATARTFAPITNVLRGARRQLGFITVSTSKIASMQAEIVQLREDQARQQIEATKLGQLLRQNAQLRDLLGFKHSRSGLDLLGASVRAGVIGGEPGALVHAIWIDQGAAAGVAARDPVANGRGLVGRVVRVYPEASQVQLINDGGSAVGARVERSRATGMLFGSASGEMTLRYIPQNAPGMPPNVVVGDVIHTSGLDAADGFPSLLPIGQVTEVRQSDERPNQEAVVRPFVDLSSLELVMVVTGWQAEPLPDADAIPAGAPKRP